MTTTTTTTGRFSESVAATQSSRERSDLWQIADALHAEVGQYDDRATFRAVAAECELAGIKPYSVSAMRQYRDTAVHWPADKRIAGLSFSAHRAALPADDPEGLLRDLVKTHGANVTVKQVNEAVAIRQHGIAAVATKAKKTATVATVADGDLIAELSARIDTHGVRQVAAGIDPAELPATAKALGSLAALLASLPGVTPAAATVTTPDPALWAAKRPKKATETETEKATETAPARRRGLRGV